MKKNILITLIAITSAFALTACGDTESPESAVAAASPATVAETTVATTETAAATIETTVTDATETATEFGTEVWGIVIDPTCFVGYSTEDTANGDVIINYIGEDAAGTSLLEIAETDYATPEEAITAAAAGRELTDFETVAVNGYDMTYAAIVSEDTEGVQIAEAYYAITWKDKTIVIDEFVTLGGDSAEAVKAKVEEALNGFYLTVQAAEEE